MKELTEEERVMTNLIFVLADINYQYMLDLETTMRKKGLDLRHETKHRFNQVMKDITQAKRSFLRFTKDINSLQQDELDKFLSTSDFLTEIIPIIIKKTKANSLEYLTEKIKLL